MLNCVERCVELNDELSIIIFQPVFAKDLAEKYTQGHSLVLERIGVNTVSSEIAWMGRESVYALLFMSGMDVLAGARLELKTDEPLPVEKSLIQGQFRFHRFWKDFAGNRVGEVCGLWSSPGLNRRGFGARHLVSETVKFAGIIGVEVLMSLCASYTVSMAESVGFRLCPEYTSSEGFPYPRSDMRAFVLLKINM